MKMLSDIFEYLIRFHPEERNQDIWFQEEARAERLSNLIRIIYLLFWLFATVPTRNFQPYSANLSNIGLGSLWLALSILLHLYLLNFSYRHFIKYLSTTLDVVFIIAILYVYHYDMGYSTTLKSIPFMTLFFVLILTTLRFRKRLPIYGGILAIVLYLVLLLFMVKFKGAQFGTMIEEFTSPKVNFFQQIYRIMYLITLAALMLILVHNIHRLVHMRVEQAKDALRQKIKHERTQRLFERYFTTKIAQYLADHPPELGGKAQYVTVMVCDLRGFTTLSEKLGPTESVDLLNRLFENLVSIVFKYNGTLDKFLGDGMLVVFGIPEPRPDDALRAVRAGMEMVDRVREIGAHEKLEMGIAINTGEVIFGNIGSSKRMEFTVIGDTVNTASRMENLNKKFNTNIIVSEHTCQALDDTILVHELPESVLRGKSGSVKLYEVRKVLSPE
jgi:class 3 adenylate cyclase